MDNADTNTKQWNKLQAMRESKGETVTKTPIIVNPPAEPNRDSETGQFTKADAPAPVPPSTTPPPAAAAAPPESTDAPKEPVAAVPPPEPKVSIATTSVEVEIDGQKMHVAPELAEAFQKAERIKQDTAKVAEREQLKAELRSELKKEFAPVKSEAELAAEAALRAAEEERTRPKKPDDNLMITDPVEWGKQREVYDEYRITKAKEDAKRETLASIQKSNADAVRQSEEQARGILREQFYSTYPVLKDSADIVDSMLKDQFDAVLASGKLVQPMTPAEAEALKKSEFADVAAKATKRLVKLMSAGKTAVPPPAPPPAVVQSQPAKVPAPKVEASDKPREKYPKGSVSSLLEAAKRAKMDRASA